MLTPCSTTLHFSVAAMTELGPPFEPRKPGLIKRTFGPIVAAVLAFLAKFKTILVLLPKLKSKR